VPVVEVGLPPQEAMVNLTELLEMVVRERLLLLLDYLLLMQVVEEAHQL
jgi:hypothetical protein